MVNRTAPCGSYSKSTHVTSAYFTVFSGILLQFFMFLYGVITMGISDPRTVLSLIVLLLIVVFLLTKAGMGVYDLIFPTPPTARDFLEEPGTEVNLSGMYCPHIMLSGYNQRRRRAKRAYTGNNSRALSISSISALLEQNKKNYRTISSLHDYLSAPSTLQTGSTTDGDQGAEGGGPGEEGAGEGTAEGQQNEESPNRTIQGSGDPDRQ
eukprot:sb/3470294/